MSSFEILPKNPVSLAAYKAEHMVHSDEFVITSEEELQVAELDYAADQLGFIGQTYFVESHKSVSVPVSFEADVDVERISYMGLTFEGEFITYSKLIVGRIIGAQSVRALCMTFDKVTMLPCFDTLPDDHLLYVPVLAVSSLSSQAA